MARIIWREPKAEPRIDGEGAEKREVKHPAPVRSIQKALDEDTLEVKSRKDGAWYEAKLQLREKGVDVMFPLFPNDNELWTWAYLKTLKPISFFIRVLSVQLQDPDCSQVSVNMRVCALNESGKLRRYDDAIVTEVERRPHEVNGMEEVCTCIFFAKWQGGPLKGRAAKLQCDKICVLSDKNVETHPAMVNILEHCSAGRSRRQDPPINEPKCKRSSIDTPDPPINEPKCKRSSIDTLDPPTNEPKCKRSSIDTPDPPTNELQCKRSSIDTPDPPTNETKCKRSSIDTPDDHGCDANGIRRFKRLKSKSITLPSNADSKESADLELPDFIPSLISPRSNSVSTSSSPDLPCGPCDIKPKNNFRDSEKPRLEKSIGTSFAVQTVNDGKVLGVVLSCKEQPKHSSPSPGPIRQQDVICLSDEEDAAAPQSSFSVISSPKDPGKSRPETREIPQFSSKESLISDFGVRAKNDDKQGWNVRPEDLARNRNFLSQKLTKSESILIIDNLELSLQPGEVLEYLLKFLPPGKVHSVHIPPPYPGLNRAVAYVVFFEKDAADSAAAFFGSAFVVSASGRPWVVTRQGQQVNENLVGFPTMSAFMGEVREDDDQLSRDSLNKLSVVTEKQQREYNAAKRRMKLFLEHRRQIRVLFHRHAQEEEKLSANPECSLYH